MNIQDALSGVTTFAEFLPITKKARAQVSSLGDRFLVVEGHIGSLHVIDLANKVKELILRRPEWTEEIRQLGFKSCQQIDRVHHELTELEESLQGKAKDLNQRKKDFVEYYTCQILDETHIHFYQQYTRHIFKSPNIQYISSEKFNPNEGEGALYVIKEFDPDGFPSCFRHIRFPSRFRYIPGSARTLSFESRYDSFFLEQDQIDESIKQKVFHLLEIGQSVSEISERGEAVESVRSSHKRQFMKWDEEWDALPEGPRIDRAPDLTFSKPKPKEIDLPEPEGGTRRFYNSEEDESYPKTAYIVKFAWASSTERDNIPANMTLFYVLFQEVTNNINYIESSKLLKNIRTFEGLAFIAKNVSVKLSIFGSRIIRIKGCVDTVKLNDLKQRLIDLFIERLQGNLEEPREVIEQAVRNISDLCVEIKRLENTCNFITKIFLRIRALFD